MMKFLIDAQLPYSLKKIFIGKGFDTIHTADLLLKNYTSDSTINHISVVEDRIVVTKDDDFYDSFMLRKIPQKLILVKTGNITPFRAIKYNFLNN